MEAASIQARAPARILAVVVTYHPPESLVPNMEALKAEVDQVLIVDNSADSEPLLQTCESRLGIEVIRNRQNLGIAAALNIGIRCAVKSGFDWVATFDQDSTVTPGFFSAMLQAYRGCPWPPRVALVAPVLCDTPEDYDRARQRSNDRAFSLITTAMTSGSLFKTEIFGLAGLYDEGLFMDYVDYDFCLRLKKKGWKVIRAERAYLLHRLGAAERHSVFGLKISIKTHSPWRRYHIMRNRFIIFRRYALVAPGWCFHDFIWVFIELTKIVVFEQHKWAKLRQVFRGIGDGLAGKTGPLLDSR